MENIIQVDELCHYYGERCLYRSLSFGVAPGQVFALLGKNGVGKTTLISILMGFLRPFGGTCRVFGEDSHALSPSARSRIGLLFEGYLCYDFLTIAQIERFYASFYPRWNAEHFFALIKILGLPHTHRIRNMSCGQKSQVVLGLLMAQEPDLLILDDYSMGLDAGYRRLFLDYLREYLGQSRRTVFLTSHVIQDMEDFVNEVLFLKRGGDHLVTSMADFRRKFRCYRLELREEAQAPSPGGIIENVERHRGFADVFSFTDFPAVREALARQGFDPASLQECPMSLEDAFIGYTGRY